MYQVVWLKLEKYDSATSKQTPNGTYYHRRIQVPPVTSIHECF